MMFTSETINLKHIMGKVEDLGFIYRWDKGRETGKGWVFYRTDRWWGWGWEAQTSPFISKKVNEK